MQNPNRMGLGMRPAMGGYGHGQGPPISALASHPLPHKQEVQPQPQGPKLVLFVGNISGGITDNFLTQLLSACGHLRSFKRTPTATGKPGAFGFAEFDEPDAVSRALSLLNGLELPVVDESGTSAKALKITADTKTKALLEAYDAQKMHTDADGIAKETSNTLISSLVESLKSGKPLDDDTANNGNDYTVPAHLKDLQEADLPESQRGIVLSEIALFRERAMKKEKDKPERDRAGPTRSAGVGGFSNGYTPPAPSKERVWGKPKEQPTAPSQQGGWGSGPQSYNKPVGFVRGSEDLAAPSEPSKDSAAPEKADEEYEKERQEARRRKEDISFRDRERRYEPRERQRIQNIERIMARERVVRESEERDRVALKQSLEEWDDDESDELFYTDRVKWRARRGHALAAEIAQDKASKAFEEREAEHLRLESEAFLARQMADLQSLQEEQRKAGLLLVGEDAGPLRLTMSLGAFGSSVASIDPTANGALAAASHGASSTSAAPKPVVKVFGDADEEEEEQGRRRRKGLIKLDFGAAAGEEATKERLAKLKDSISKDKEALFKFKVRWEALSDQLIDTKFEPLIKRKMKEYLGEMEDDDLIMFVVEHLKDRKGPQKLVEGLEPVLMEEAEELAISLWRQVVFESVAYAEGLETQDIVLA